MRKSSLSKNMDRWWNAVRWTPPRTTVPLRILRYTLTGAFRMQAAGPRPICECAVSEQRERLGGLDVWKGRTKRGARRKKNIYLSSSSGHRISSRASGSWATQTGARGGTGWLAWWEGLKFNGSWLRPWMAHQGWGGCGHWGMGASKGGCGCGRHSSWAGAFLEQLLVILVIRTDSSQ